MAVEEREPLTLRGCILPCGELGSREYFTAQAVFEPGLIGSPGCPGGAVGPWRLVSEHQGEGMGRLSPFIIYAISLRL